MDCIFTFSIYIKVYVCMSVCIRIHTYNNYDYSIFCNLFLLSSLFKLVQIHRPHFLKVLHT